MHGLYLSYINFIIVPDAPTGLRELEVSNETTKLQWRPPAIYNCTISNEVSSIYACNSISYLVACQLAMESASVTMPDELVSVEVPGNKTCATITLRKGKTYKCSVQAQNQCQLLSNHSNSIEIHIPGKLVHSFSNSYDS